MDTTGGFNRKGTIELSIGEQQENSSTVSRRHGSEFELPQQKVINPNTKVSEDPLHVRRNHRWIRPRDSLPDRENEMLETAGTPGEAFTLNRTPLIAGQDDLILEVSSPDGWERWTRVETFANREPGEDLLSRQRDR